MPDKYSRRQGIKYKMPTTTLGDRTPMVRGLPSIQRPVDEFTVQVKGFHHSTTVKRAKLPRILQSTTKWTQSDDRNDTQERHHDNE